MNWAAFHGVAEELALWSTLLVNSVLIIGAVPTLIAMTRRAPPKKLIQMASIGGSIGLVGVTVAFTIWVIASPHPFGPMQRYGHGGFVCGPSKAEIEKLAKTPQEQQRLMESLSDSIGGCIILGGEPPDWYGN